MSQTRESFCETLRKCVSEATGRRRSKSAVFFAEKLVTLSPTADDVFTFAQALYDNAEYRRAVSVLEAHRLTLRSHRFACLAGRCLLGCKAYEECIALIGGENELDGPEFEEPDQTPEWTATLYVIRGQTWEALENLSIAGFWYRKALMTDPFCYDAFYALIEKDILLEKDRTEFFESLSCTHEAAWIKVLYLSMSSRYAGNFDLILGRMNETMRFLSTSEPLRPSDTTNRSRHSQADSHHSSSLGFGDSIENLDGEMVDQPRAGLDSSLDVRLARAEWYYARGSNLRAYALTKHLLEKFPEALKVYPVHLAACLELQKTSELYLRGQKLATLCPNSALAYYAFGVYYMSTKNFPEARKAFTRSNSIDRNFAASWIGLGHAFSAQSETQQALVAYRTAQTLFPGLHLPSLYIGMEHLRLNARANAKVSFQFAYNQNPGDPSSLCQMAVADYYAGAYRAAVDTFGRAISKIPTVETVSRWHPVFLNLGHALRKDKRYSDALKSYEKALSLCPRHAGTLSAIGFIHHLEYRHDAAVEYYTKALIYDPNSIFAQVMLEDVAEDCLVKR